ncbi:MAG: hypothetical protein Q8M76_15435, partial [Spirochaetaceae bacterium]|nr:hypothetical protein [Spirochaetaceae bacterium]
PSLPRDDELFAAREAERCLACDSACLRCVEVCPNRANTAIAVGGEPFRQSLQILHVDYLCNECGNCGSFCPWEGEPYKGKITLFRDLAALEASRNVGFYLAAGEGEPGTGTPRLVALRAAYGGPSLSVPASVPASAPASANASDAVLSLARIVASDHAYLLGGAQ